jgi:hypothetical protein
MRTGRILQEEMSSAAYWHDFDTFQNARGKTKEFLAEQPYG